MDDLVHVIVFGWCLASLKTGMIFLKKERYMAYKFYEISTAFSFNAVQHFRSSMLAETPKNKNNFTCVTWLVSIITWVQCKSFF